MAPPRFKTRGPPLAIYLGGGGNGLRLAHCFPIFMLLDPMKSFIRGSRVDQ